ncbi:MAG TPA: hypothetical protein VM368_07250 [Flavisolibacter sp.]|nr:hypothetical protein [Flavisolibacter sp.]
MQSNFVKAGLFAAALVIAFIFSWEIYLRNNGNTISYDDGEPLWSDKRAKVYLPSDQATVFIGSSRIKYDLDIPTWENLTGDKAVQLAFVGSSPLPVLFHLADDPEFKGKMIIDVVEGLLFGSNPMMFKRPNESIDYYKKRTPTQRASFQVNHFLESNFVFLNSEYFTINRYLTELRIPDRSGVMGEPLFPKEFGRISFERQRSMTEEFVKDTNLQKQVKDIWAFFGRALKEPPPQGAKLDSILQSIKVAVNKIKSRGGEVIFVRPPSSGPYLMAEQKGFPREKYWNKLLKYTSTPGIHFKDDPATANFVCPEFSHLSPEDAITYTKALIRTLEQKGWKFPYKPAAQKQLAANK